jgi:ABC-type bacteriocin/lantibiotic exporter with double-glycine peptidase domain
VASLVLLRALSSTTRGLLAGVAVLGVIARIAIVVAAVEAAQARAQTSAIAALVASGAWLVQRLVASHARVSIECELHRAAANAVLASDVVGVRDGDLQRAIFEGNSHGRTYLAATLPGLAGDLVALVVTVPLVMSALPARAVAMAVIAFALVTGSLVIVRRATRRASQDALTASERVYADMLRVAEERLEVVAHGGEEETTEALRRDLETYSRIARRANLRAGALGRVPIALAAVVIGAIVLLDGTTRASLESVVIGQAVVLAAFAPTALGVVFSVAETARLAPLLEPFLRLLRSERRGEIARRGLEAPELPAVVCARRLTFAYAKEAPPILERVSFEWRPGAPLVVLGPNGSGKSTLLRLLIGLRAPSEGSVTIGDRELDAIDLVATRRHVAYLPQRPYLGEPYTPLREALRGMQDGGADEELVRVMNRVGLGGVSLDEAVGVLSAGQRQRVALARVLLRRAPLVILDEPDANLDRDGVAFVRSLIEELVSEKAMVAFAAHTPELAAIPGVRVPLERRARTADPSA